MSAEIQREIQRLKAVQHDLWLVRGDLSHVHSERRSQLSEQIRQLHRQIDALEDRYYDVLEEEEEEQARQASLRRGAGGKKRRYE